MKIDTNNFEDVYEDYERLLDSLNVFLDPNVIFCSHLLPIRPLVVKILSQDYCQRKVNGCHFLIFCFDWEAGSPPDFHLCTFPVSVLPCLILIWTYSTFFMLWFLRWVTRFVGFCFSVHFLRRKCFVLSHCTCCESTVLMGKSSTSVICLTSERFVRSTPSRGLKIIQKFRIGLTEYRLKYLRK